MTFLTVLAALFIERVLSQHRPQRRHAWFERYSDWLAGSSAARRLLDRPWGALLALLPPLAAIAWLQSLFAELGSLFEWAFGTVVLLHSLGPRDLDADTEAFLGARDAGDEDRATALGLELCRVEPPPDEPRRSFAVARGIVVLASRRLIGPLFWFVAFGAVGSAAYRGVHLLAERLQAGDCPDAVKHHSDRLRQVADWAPARISAAGYAVAGNFEGVAQAWHSVDAAPAGERPGGAELLLAQTGLAALDTYPDDEDGYIRDSAHAAGEVRVPPVVEDALALVWRSLAVWVAVIAGGSLVAALA